MATIISLVQPLQPSGLRCFSKKSQKLSPVRGKTRLRCRATLTRSLESAEKPRRSSDYLPTIWSPQLIESIRSPYKGGEYTARTEELKQEVRQLLKETNEPLARLELIDSVRHLGIAYHFDEEIRAALARFCVDGFESLNGLKETSVCFRLLREYAHYVSSDVFLKFREGEAFKKCLSQDVVGLLSLYEATHVALPDGERILEEAKEFSVKHLQHLSEDIEPNLAEQVRHSLEAPLYWLMPRLEARNYLDVVEKEKGKASCLLELAKLDFNVVQALHQKEIKELSSWWEKLGLVKECKFSRDRIFENYFWANGTAFEPQFSKCRKVMTKVISIGVVIDDFYDTYSTLEEAELFTVAIRRWDLKAAKDLPNYSKQCFIALYNFVNETANDILMDYGLDVRHLLAREWINLCEAFLVEARWFHKRITPSLEEYLENGRTSVGGGVILFHAFYFAGHSLTEESMDHSKQACNLIYLSSLLVRLIDDLAPSKAEMEETSLSIQCYMKESGESYETSVEFVKELICRYWKELNMEALSSNLPANFVHLALNTPRACFTLSQEEDGIGTPTGIVKKRISSLFVEQIFMD